MVFKKWQKPPKKWQKISEVEVKKEEKPVTTVVKEEMNNAELPAGTIIKDESELFLKKSTKWTKFKESQIMGDVGWTIVTKPQGRIKFEAQVAPYPMFMLPDELKRWLISNWLTTDVYRRDKERLEKHNVDLEMVEKLKKFLTERL